MSGGGAGAAAGELRAVVRRAIDDLSGTAPWLPGMTGGEPARRAAETMVRLSGELARAAAMALALPGSPPELPGYTFAAATAIAVAEREEEDPSRWLSTVLISVTTNASILSACVTADLMAGRDEIAPPLLYQHGSNSRFAAPPFIRRIPAIVGDPGPLSRSGARRATDGPGAQPGPGAESGVQ
jgi:hypothetical protein